MKNEIENEKKRNFLMQLSVVSGVCVEICTLNEFTVKKAVTEKSDTFYKLRLLLVDLAKQQEEPVLFEDRHHILWLCFLMGEQVVFIGPMVHHWIDSLELHYYYKDYQLEKSSKNTIPVLSIKKIIGLLHLMKIGLGNLNFSEENFLEVNHISVEPENSDNQELSIFQTNEDLEESYHHTYQEERKLLDCVREGRVEEALNYNLDIDMATGRLSKKELDHWKKVVIVAVTLCTRAAIEGGISPAAAYQLSDYYIQKCDQYSKISDLIVCRNKAVRELTKQVQRKKEGKKTSSYVEQCKDYIRKNYKEKMYLKEIADTLGLSPTYLSRLFSKETGMSFQEYVNWFKIERAVNLLIYSDESIAHIGEYVNFPSQSYFGRMFKKYKKITPGEYRNQNKPKEFTT